MVFWKPLEASAFAVIQRSTREVRLMAFFLAFLLHLSLVFCAGVDFSVVNGEYAIFRKRNEAVSGINRETEFLSDGGRHR
jgi:hypothetical protein